MLAASAGLAVGIFFLSWTCHYVCGSTSVCLGRSLRSSSAATPPTS